MKLLMSLILLLGIAWTTQAAELQCACNVQPREILSANSRMNPDQTAEISALNELDLCQNETCTLDNEVHCKNCETANNYSQPICHRTQVSSTTVLSCMFLGHLRLIKRTPIVRECEKSTKGVSSEQYYCSEPMCNEATYNEKCVPTTTPSPTTTAPAVETTEPKAEPEPSKTAAPEPEPKPTPKPTPKPRPATKKPTPKTTPKPQSAKKAAGQKSGILSWISVTILYVAALMY